jgi:hypothetical protein
MTMPSSETELEDNGTDWGEYVRGGGEGVDRYEAELLLMLLSGEVLSHGKPLIFGECGEHDRLIRTKAALHSSI